MCLTPIMSQEVETVLSAPEGWRSEILPFPLAFAPEIDFDGFQDVRFAPGWADQSSDEFWTYHFIWYIRDQPHLTEDLLTDFFMSYYDGLSAAVLNLDEKSSDGHPDKTLCLFIKSEDGYKGKIRAFDPFFTQDYITINISIEESYCHKRDRYIVSFDISPQPFTHHVWEIFESVQVIVGCD